MMKYKMSEKSKKLIVDNIELVDKNIARWIKEEKEKVNIDWKRLLKDWQEITGKNLRTTAIPDKSKRQFRARMREGATYEDIITAIKNGYKSDHHTESQHKWFTLDLISRSQQFNLYLDMEMKELNPQLKNPYK